MNFDFSNMGEESNENPFPQYHTRDYKLEMPGVKLQPDEKYDFEFFVIGGGSGGAALARYAGTGSYKVALADYVDPSWQGSTWGVGGTCVNVGCIPKKLMHISASWGTSRGDMRNSGWDLGQIDNTLDADQLKDTNSEPQDSKNNNNVSDSNTDSRRLDAFNWTRMKNNVQSFVKNSSKSIEETLQNSGVVYYNAKASILGPHSVEIRKKDGKIMNKSAKYIIIATGGRPNDDQFEGCREHTISSDDIFSLEKPPGKTLVVGAAYIALECGGFLRGMGYPVDILVRSILLRGFDQEIAEKIGDFMKHEGVGFIRPSTIQKITANENGTKQVFYTDPANKDNILSAQYDTVLMAVGRHPNTKGLGLENIGAELAPSGKLLTNRLCQVQGENCQDVYAIGDVVEGKLELTPTAIMDGKLLVGRLLNVHHENMNWDKIPTTVFTPLEYGLIGLSEEQCVEKYGEQGYTVYAKEFRPLEWEYLGRSSDLTGYVKILCESEGNKKVVGMHYLGPNAGEVVQGYAVAIRLGATKYDLDCTVAIHPTSSEYFLLMDQEGKGAKGPC